MSLLSSKIRSLSQPGSTPFTKLTFLIYLSLFAFTSSCNSFYTLSRDITLSEKNISPSVKSLLQKEIMGAKYFILELAPFKKRLAPLQMGPTIQERKQEVIKLHLL